MKLVFEPKDNLDSVFSLFRCIVCWSFTSVFFKENHMRFVSSALKTILFPDGYSYSRIKSFEVHKDIPMFSLYHLQIEELVNLCSVLVNYL